MSTRERSGAAKDVRAGLMKSPVTSRTNAKATPKPIKFETRWRAETLEFQGAIARLATYLQQWEDVKGLRTRARKAVDREKFERAVEAICCNFVAASLFDPARRLAVKLGNYASSQSPVYGKHFNRAVELMQECGLLTCTKGRHYAGSMPIPSTIHPTPSFWRRVAMPNGIDALRLEEHHRFVFVNAAKKGPKPLVPPSWLQIAEEEMVRINDSLRTVPLRYSGNETFVPDDDWDKASVPFLTPHHRTVRRVFKGGIDQGGRLYDGFWETMPRGDRFRHLTINGEQVVNVDFGQLFLRLAYANADQTPPPGDLYDLTGSDHERDNWPALREGRKKLVNALLLTNQKKLRQWPGKTAAKQAEVKDCFPPGTRPTAAIAAVKQRHSAIADEWFEKGQGMKLHRQESDILVAVLLRLIDLEIPALPLHDSVIVAKSDGIRVRQIMEEEALRLTGVDIPVKIDAG